MERTVNTGFDVQAAAARTAGALLDIGAVQVDAQKPFILTSGRASPVYIDCRRLISHLAPRRQVIVDARALLESVAGMVAVDYVAGGETAGISYAAWLSEALGRPMLYVRKKPKGFGRNARIEGEMKDGARVLLVEDLTTDGGSKASFAQALRDAGAEVRHAFSVFYYGIYPQSAGILAQAGLELHALATWHDVYAQARARRLLTAAEDAVLADFFNDPDGWSRRHGGIAPAAA
jgi:orotate phosphoribosyltransferase